jgi:hypothetical protein
MPALFKRMNRARQLFKHAQNARRRMGGMLYSRKARRHAARLPFKLREADIKRLTIYCAQMNFPLERLPELARMMRNNIAKTNKHAAATMNSQMFLQELERLGEAAQNSGIPHRQLGLMLRQQRAIGDIVRDLYRAGQ